MIPSDLRYTKTHEYVREESGQMVAGITEFAAEALGDVVYLELPELDSAVKRGESFGVVESVKAVSDLYAPVSGRVVAVNDAAVEDPSMINQDPYGKGWMLKIEPSESLEEAGFLSAAEYEAFTKDH